MTLRNATVFYDWSQTSLANFSGGLLRIPNHGLLYWCAIGASTLPESVFVIYNCSFAAFRVN
jgi:hypothetical protein